jgi:hypothetical protein
MWCGECSNAAVSAGRHVAVDPDEPSGVDELIEAGRLVRVDGHLAAG